MKQRRSWDSQGNPIVEINTGEGYGRRARDDTALSKLNADALSLAATHTLKRPGQGGTARSKAPTVVPTARGTPFTPAAKQGIRPDKNLRQRSSLDYLRALSVEIKKKRQRGGKDE